MNNIDDKKAAVIAAATISHRNTGNPSNRDFEAIYDAFQTLFSKFEPNGDDPFYKELKESGIGHNEICKILLCNYVYIMIVTNWKGDVYTDKYYRNINNNNLMKIVNEMDFDEPIDNIENYTLFTSETVSKFSENEQIKKATVIVQKLHNSKWL